MCLLVVLLEIFDLRDKKTDWFKLRYLSIKVKLNLMQIEDTSIE
jgi:hypothetical protein